MTSAGRGRHRSGSLEATDEDGRPRAATRILTVTAHYRDWLRGYRKARTRRLTVRSNSEVVVRRIGKTLGGILGLTPKGMLCALFSPGGFSRAGESCDYTETALDGESPLLIGYLSPAGERT